MYSTTDKYKRAIYQEDAQHLLKIYVNESSINIDEGLILEFNITQSLFNGDEFAFGNAPSAMIELKLYKNNLPSKFEKIYIQTGVQDQIIPIGYFTVESIKEDEDIVTIKAIDNMIKFEFNYNGKQLIDIKGKATLLEVAQDICLKAGVELRFCFFFKYE